MTTSQHDVNIRQYQDKSTIYLHSQTHAQGIEFAKMQKVVVDNQLEKILDLGCGGGHVTYQLAPFAQHITAYDLVENMLTTVQNEAQNRGFNHVTTQAGTAEHLPFDNAQFDAVITRYSAHHWQNVLNAMHEIYRVTRTKGKVIVVDVLGNANPVLNNFLQTIETIRDPSHVKDYSLSEWLYFAEVVGFRVETIEKQPLYINFDDWVARMHTSADSIQVIRQLQQHCADCIKTYFQVDDKGNFTTEVIYMVLAK